MNDVFLVLAQAEGGVTCFVVPRVLPDGTRNRLDVVRLKDKLGNRSNASSELELDGTLAQRLGDEGRGVRTIIEMVAATRLDCVLGSASLMRHALAEASWHVAHRSAFGVAARRQAADAERRRRPRRRVGGRHRARACGWPRPSTGPTTRTRRRCAGSRCRWRSSGSASARPAMVAEALECLGGNGYVEESGLPLLFRESPLNSIWEGSGNVNALDVLRALGREPEVLQAWITEVGAGPRRRPPARPGRRRHARAARRHRRRSRSGARRLAGRMAACLQGSLLVRFAPARGRRRLLRQPARDVVRRHVRDADQRVAARRSWTGPHQSVA